MAVFGVEVEMEVLVSAALHCGSVVISRQTHIPFRDIA
jgi:hypothetical protein